MDLKTKADKYIEGLLAENEKLIFEEEIKDNLEIKEYLIRRKLVNDNSAEYFQSNETRDKDVEEDIHKYLHHYNNDNKTRESEFRDIIKKLPAKGPINSAYSVM